MNRIAAALVPLALVLFCAAGTPQPAELDPANDTCAGCRMAVSDPQFASQLVAPGEEPKFYDDIGCLATWTNKNAPLPKGAMAYVADHRTKEWIAASSAVFVKCEAVATPMGSHILAFGSRESLDADPMAKDCKSMTAQEVFRGAAVPDGK
ncbi:MAG: nitrous oxide reductase accessory protein NosL [Thermoanaerobaculia bacterium]